MKDETPKPTESKQEPLIFDLFKAFGDMLQPIKENDKINFKPCTEK